MATVSPRMSWIFFASASLPLARTRGERREGPIEGAPGSPPERAPHGFSSLCPIPPPPRSRFESLFHVRRRVRRRAAILPPGSGLFAADLTTSPVPMSRVPRLPFFSSPPRGKKTGRGGKDITRAPASSLTMDINGIR